MFWEKGKLALSFKPWYRMQEDEKEFEFDPDGDDDPDIEDFYGKFELGAVCRGRTMNLQHWDDEISTNNGAIRLEFTFPLWGKLRGYAVGFDSYGDSLIDYNHKQTRFGIGIALNPYLQ